MTPEEFRGAGHELIDWIADFRAGIESLPVRAQVEPGEVRGRFDPKPPSGRDSISTLIDMLESDIVPGVTQVQHPMHFGWFPSNASLASVLGDIASSGIGSLGISWESSPALTEVEEVVCDWMRRLVGLSDAWRGTIHDTASTACLVALLVARERASGLSQNRGGIQELEAPLVVYTSRHAHSSVTKAALLAGYGWDNIRIIECDESMAMKPGALAAAIERDVAAGSVPAAIVATVGTTGTTAMDPIDEIVAIAARRGLFIHVDAAMAGSAMLLPERRHLWEGVEAADSISWNPHKWMGTILDTALFYMRDVELLTRVMSTNPSYLRSSAFGAVTQYRNWGVPLGRRFRALKLLFHLRIDGIDAIRDRIRRDLAHAEWLAGEVSTASEWELVAPLSLQTVCVRHRPDGLERADLDKHTRRWVETINRSGEAYLTAAEIDDGWVARVSIGVETTERHHVERMWELMKRAAAESATAVVRD
ncbi:MAG: pyridoxal-dependent decarboxylase [Acidimicrobiia bacterium]|nr:pyridoxal-dependent decarboxylase [Acidimicrobiia bacterium]